MSLHYSDDTKKHRLCGNCIGDGYSPWPNCICNGLGFLGDPDAQPDIEIKWRDLRVNFAWDSPIRRKYCYRSPNKMNAQWVDLDFYDTLDEALEAARVAVREES